MDANIELAYLIAETLTKGKSTEELAALQITLQTISSLVAADLASKRNASTDSNRSSSK